MKKTVVLIGFPGAGKTSVGKALRDSFSWRWVDVDEAVESAAGRSIAELIRVDGEESFRALERKEVKAALAKNVGVVSLGGGALLDEETRREVLENCLVVHLEVSAETAAKRVAEDEVEANKLGITGLRPLLSGADNKGLQEKVETLMNARKDLYSNAHVVLKTDGTSPEQLAKKIVQLIEEES